MPTVWDAFSAKLAASAGFKSLTVGSHPVADSLGSKDGENMDFADYLGAVQRITGSVDVPVSADVESRSEEHTSELQSREKLVCRLLPDKKNLKRDPEIRETEPR